MNLSACLPDLGDCVCFGTGFFTSNDDVDLRISSQRHHGCIEGRVAAAHDDDMLADVVADLGDFLIQAKKGNLSGPADGDEHIPRGEEQEDKENDSFPAMGPVGAEKQPMGQQVYG